MTYEFCRGIGPAAARSSCSFITSTSSTTQAYFFPLQVPSLERDHTPGHYLYEDEGRPQSKLPLADCHKQSQISASIVSSSGRADTPQVPFQTLSQNSGSHLSRLSAPLFTEDRYSTSIDNDQRIVMQKSARLRDGEHHHKQLP